MNENEAKELLKIYGISRPPYFILNRVERIDAKSIRNRGIRFPVVAKIIGDDIAHKTDVRGVRVGINSPKELLEVIEDFRARFPKSEILVEEFVYHNVEFILGVKKDKTFGPVIMFGAGGILTEIYDDVVFRRLPVDKDEALEMICSPRIGKIFEGYRGVDFEPHLIAKAISNLSKLVMDWKDRIWEIDINPLVCVNGSVIGLDAKIVLLDKDTK